MDMKYKTVIEIRDAIANKEITSQEVVEFYLDKIKKDDDRIGAFLETFNEDAIAKAKKIDELIASGKSLPRLAGVPIAIKDNICYAGKTASAGSKNA